MADTAGLRSTLRAVDAAALARLRRRLLSAPAAPWLHAEVARRMAERLPIIKQQPRRVLDWWAGSSASAEPLRLACPQARLVPVWPAGMATLPAPDAPAWWSPRRWRQADEPPVPADALPRHGADLLWANMMLHWCADPQAEMQRWADATAVDGFLMFSTLGPGTLAGLRSLYAARGWPAPHAPFVDMHDLGDMLVQAGFADPVMDQETLNLNWADGAALLAELRGLGANLDPARSRGLRTPRWRDTLLQALDQDLASDGRPSLEFEIVYGHAFKPPPRAALGAETAVGLEDMRSILRSRRAP